MTVRSSQFTWIMREESQSRMKLDARTGSPSFIVKLSILDFWSLYQ